MLLLCSCTVYTEKQSEALSQNVYAANDSLNTARIDLAEYYSDQSIRLVKPPKKRIDIQPIYETSDIPGVAGKSRVVIIPDQYKNDKVVIVNSTEYQDLQKNKDIAEQLKRDLANKILAQETTDQELIKQAENRDKMVNDLNVMQKKLIQKDLVILRLYIVIGVLAALIGVYAYLRINKLFF
jgi:hypothetical protein